MINNEELLFIVDENNNPLSPQPRNYAHKNGLWHRTTGIWVINGKKQILCQKRSLNKDVKPGFWEAFFGGHLAPNEDYLQSAVNEVREELGIEIDKNDLIPFKILKSDKPNHREFQHIFALKLKSNDNCFNFEKDEIDELCWKDIDEVKKILLDRKDPNWVLKPWDTEVLHWLTTI